MRSIITWLTGTTRVPASKLYGDKTFYSRFVADLKHAKEDVVIESPFLTKKRITSMAPTFVLLSRRGINVKIVTRSPTEYNMLFRDEALSSILYLRLLGARVTTTNKRYHRKLAIIDGRILWEGSLNILSQNNSIEIMRRTDSCDTVNQMKLFLRTHK